MCRAVEAYRGQLPGGWKEEQLPDGSTVSRSVFTPHSLRAMTATLLLDAGVDTGGSLMAISLHKLQKAFALAKKCAEQDQISMKQRAYFRAIARLISDSGVPDADLNVPVPDDRKAR